MENLFIKIFFKISSKYFLLVISFFILYYIINKQKWIKYKIQQKFPKNREYIREGMYSLITMIIFTCILIGLNSKPIVGYTTRYYEISERGWVYYYLLFIIMFFVHDAYFYFIHRIMHYPKIFKYIHLIHHKSTNPSPWAAYSFHPFEAIIEQGIILIFYFTVPIHITHLTVFFLFSIIYNIYGHLGYEIYPKGFNKTRIGKWINTSISHNQHHQFCKGNYGLYTLIWDRLFGTLRNDYDVRFNEVKNR